MLDNLEGKVEAVSISQKKGEKKINQPSISLKENFGIIGDAHAGDKIRQVSLLSLSSFEKIRSKGLNVKPGDFAENITVKDFDLMQLSIGEILKIGEDVLLQISQIGKECHDRCHIYNSVGDCVMPTEGIFTKVVQGGKIKPGDSIKIDKRYEATDRRPPHESQVSSLKSQVSSHKIYKAAILTISDSCFKGQRQDETGKTVSDLIEKSGFHVQKYDLVADDPLAIREKLIYYADSLHIDLILTNGGTGFSLRDFTPEVTKEVIEREVPGIPEAMRYLTSSQTKRAYLSRAAAGIRGRTLIINLPGSPTGAGQSLTSILDLLDHAMQMIEGKGHS